MEWLVAVITVSAAVVTIVWFVRDIRKENTKVLKAILDAQQRALEIQREEAHILAKIEEGQRRGFQTLAEIESRGFETLAQLLVKAGVK
jgi:hypothetical protein